MAHVKLSTRIEFDHRYNDAHIIIFSQKFQNSDAIKKYKIGSDDFKGFICYFIE